MKLIFIDFLHLVSLEQFHDKPMGIHDGGLLKLALVGK